MRDFGKEVSVMAELHHPNVVMLMGFCAKPPVLVMEYMGRGSLFRVLHATDIRLHPTMLLHVLVDVACGMSCVRSLATNSLTYLLVLSRSSTHLPTHRSSARFRPRFSTFWFGCRQ